MKKLWEFSTELQRKLIEAHLCKYGTLIGEMSSPHSSIYTFDQGTNVDPRYIVAKGIQVDSTMPEQEKKKYFRRALYEVNNAYLVLHHPLIHRFFDVDVVHCVPFLLSRKKDATLRDVISEGPLALAEAISIASQIVHALAYCSRQGIDCHQDLKPENIFVDFIRNHFVVPPEYPLRYRVYLADFELANAYRVLRHPYGSRPYMAPEQYKSLNEGPLPDFSRTDVFAVGVMLFEMLTGGVHPIGERTTLIWPQPTERKSRKWLREDAWKQWSKDGAAAVINSQIDETTRLIVADCLNPDPAERPSTTELEKRLLERLNELHKLASETLSLTLAQFDRIATESQEAGWPYYEDRLNRLNDAYPDNSPLT